MDSSSSLIHYYPLTINKENGLIPNIFDTSKQSDLPLPKQFFWPGYTPQDQKDELKEEPISLKGFFNGDQEAINLATKQIKIACSKHGFFQVINHGVDANLIRATHQHMDAFFKLPLSKKISLKRKPGGLCGYSGAHADRYSSKLPWKETFSFTHLHANVPGVDVHNYIKSQLGNQFEEAGCVYQKYCEAMKNLSLVIFELLAISLGVDDWVQLREFFEDGKSIMRGNNYPACREAGLTLGTGPHSDPNSLTILHQDDVGGLEIFSDNKWQSIKPRFDAFVVNIGDTFMALTNGRYKSCVHRAVVNKEKVRRSLVYFVSPKEDKIVRPLVFNNKDKDEEADEDEDEARLYPNFTWLDLRVFTQNHYRADTTTLQNFIFWLHSNSNSNSNSNSKLNPQQP